MRLGIQICSEFEWKSIRSILKIDFNELAVYPFGLYFRYRLGQYRSIIYFSGATKTRAAGACQFAIDNWKPNIIVNIGTCGGVAEGIKMLDIIMATKTFQYDVVQRFGKPSLPFKRGLETDLEVSWINLDKVSKRFYTGTIASADQDLCLGNRKILQRLDVLGADWESASIAKVCELNRIRCLILRGVSDIPKSISDSQIGAQERDYKRNTRIIMKSLLLIIEKMGL